MRHSVAAALISALAMAFFVPPMILIAIDQRAMLKEGVDYPPDFVKWSPTAQNEWRLSNHRMVSGIPLLRERIKHDSAFPREYVQSIVSVFLLTLVGNFLFAGVYRALTRRSTGRPASGPPVN